MELTSLPGRPPEGIGPHDVSDGTEQPSLNLRDTEPHLMALNKDYSSPDDPIYVRYPDGHLDGGGVGVAEELPDSRSGMGHAHQGGSLAPAMEDRQASLEGTPTIISSVISTRVSDSPAHFESLTEQVRPVVAGIAIEDSGMADSTEDGGEFGEAKTDHGNTESYEESEPLPAESGGEGRQPDDSPRPETADDAPVPDRHPQFEPGTVTEAEDAGNEHQAPNSHESPHPKLLQAVVAKLESAGAVTLHGSPEMWAPSTFSELRFAVIDSPDGDVHVRVEATADSASPPTMRVEWLDEAGMEWGTSFSRSDSDPRTIFTQTAEIDQDFVDLWRESAGRGITGTYAYHRTTIQSGFSRDTWNVVGRIADILERGTVNQELTDVYTRRLAIAFGTEALNKEAGERRGGGQSAVDRAVLGLPYLGEFENRPQRI